MGLWVKMETNSMCNMTVETRKIPGMRHCQNKRKGIDGVGKKLKRRVCHRKSMKKGVRPKQRK